jgi:hypothetical protein
MVQDPEDKSLPTTVDGGDHVDFIKITLTAAASVSRAGGRSVPTPPT